MKKQRTSNTAKVNKSSTETIYESKVGEVIKQIEEKISEGTFNLRWDATPCNFNSKRKYTNLNLLLILFNQMIKGSDYQSKFWLTAKQAAALGYSIKKGEKATYISCWFSVKKPDDSNTESKSQVESNSIDSDDQTKKMRMAHKSVAIFNLEQTTATIETQPISRTSYTFSEQLDALKTMMFKTNVEFNEGGDSAFYSPLHHSIKMPFFQHFIGESQTVREHLYLTTLAHELAHSTMQKLRPQHYNPMVDSSSSKFLYAKEEVVAEITAAMLCATLGIEKQILLDHCAYIRGWLDLAKQETPNYFTQACKLASEAHDYLISQVDFNFDVSMQVDADQISA
jgi:antirestriction protein ArdC